MTRKTLAGELLDEQAELSMHDLCVSCSTTVEAVVELVDEGVIEPIAYEETQWRFSGPSLVKARTAIRIQRDLKVNLAGAALAVELMEEIETVRERLRRFEMGDDS